LAYLVLGVWGIIYTGKWSPSHVLPLLACFLPTLLHLALTLPRSGSLTAKHPYLLRWIYGLPILALVASLEFWSIAPLMGADFGNNMGFLLARKFHSQPGDMQTLIALPCFAAAVALLTGCALSVLTLGWKKAIVRRPAWTIMTLLFAPGCAAIAIVRGGSMFSLSQPVLDAAAFMVHAVLYSQFLAARSAVLIIFPIATCMLLLRSYRPLKWRGEAR
jgi:hypothetical protein